jgi:hypothetical protein
MIKPILMIALAALSVSLFTSCTNCVECTATNHALGTKETEEHCGSNASNDNWESRFAFEHMFQDVTCTDK